MNSIKVSSIIYFPSKNSDLEGISTVTYSFVQLKNATNNFKLDNKVGEGGFGVVYKVLLLN